MKSSLLEMMPFDLAYLLIAMFLCILILFVLVINLQTKYRKLKISYTRFMRGKDGKTLEESFLKKYQDIDDAVTLTKKNEKSIEELAKEVKESYQKVGIVRYDAFPDDIGAKLSFALTLLNSHDDGFILNALHTENRCYVYVKEIIKGQSYVELSEEESESLDRAIFQEAYGLGFQGDRSKRI